MQFAELGDHFGAQRDGAAAAGMIPAGRACGDRRGHRPARGGFQRRQQVGLGVEQVGGVAGSSPVARSGAGARCRRRWSSALPACRCRRRRRSRTDCRSAKPRAALRAAAASSDGSTRGAQRIQVGGDGIGKLARLVAAAEQSGLVAGDEGKAHALVEAARRQRPAHGAGAALRRRQHRLGHGAGRAPAATDGTSVRPWMRTISSTRSAGPSTSRRQDWAASHARCRHAPPPRSPGRAQDAR